MYQSMHSRLIACLCMRHTKIIFDRSIYNLRWSKIHSNAKDGWMTNWDVHTIGGIAAGLKGWAGLNKTEAKHVIYCIIETIQDDTRE